jgi:acetyl-CoA carboxylase biotin carboxyl carrier protein
MDFNQIQEIIRLVSKLKLTEFEVKDGEFKLTIKNQTLVKDKNQAAGQVMIPATSPLVTMAPPVAQAPAATPPPAAPAAAPAAPAAAAPKEDSDANLVPVKSPMVGTFYRSGSPDKPPFVKVGDTIDVGTTVCIIEAMKLFNEIESDVKGKIVKVLVEDATPVEYDQPLFLVEPA